jgi:hypothetical protein
MITDDDFENRTERIKLVKEWLTKYLNLVFINWIEKIIITKTKEDVIYEVIKIIKNYK